MVIYMSRYLINVHTVVLDNNRIHLNSRTARAQRARAWFLVSFDFYWSGVGVFESNSISSRTFHHGSRVMDCEKQVGHFRYSPYPLRLFMTSPCSLHLNA